MAKNKHSRKHKSRKINSMELLIDNQEASSFAGLSLVERLASRLGIWTYATKNLPVRSGFYDRIQVVKGAVSGFLSGSRGTALLDAVAQDNALLRGMGIDSLPGEKIFWEDLDSLGKGDTLAGLHRLNDYSAKRVLMKVEPEDIQITNGFIPLFGDGTLLEGSRKREGTKYINKKGCGLMWGAWMLGPMVAATHLCDENEGEQSALFNTLDDVLERVVDPLGWRSRVLVLMDSLHGDGPSLDRIEKEGLAAIIGANKLSVAKERLAELPESGWKEVPSKNRRKGLVEEDVCAVYVQCEGWKKKRLVIGKRFKREDDLFWNYSGVFTTISPRRLGFLEESDSAFMVKIWNLYDLKMGMEDRFKDLLRDLSGHRPPCGELARNRGYYALLTLAHNLARGVDLVAGAQNRKALRKAGKRTAQRARIATLRRHLFALPGHITAHSRKATITLIGGGADHLRWFKEYWDTLAIC